MEGDIILIKAVIFDMYETLITLYESPLYFGTQMAEDAGITEEHFQSVWYLKEKTMQPAREMKDFVNVKSPMDILELVN